jgi:cytochrome c oxidase cbb3-type subunit 3
MWEVSIMGITMTKGLVLCLMVLMICTLTVSMSARAEEAAAVENPFAGDADAIAEGADLFDEYCSECHGDGTGGTGPDLTDSEWLYGGTDSDIYQSITNGRPGGMPAMQYDMGKEEIWKAITFVRSLQK